MLVDISPPRTKREIVLERARQLVKSAGITKPPVDIEKLAHFLGVQRIVQVDFARTDACLLPGRNGHTILVKETSSQRRRRFSIAHELGHILLGASSIKLRGHILDKSNDKLNKEEQLCNQIAAELLMPEPLFRQEIIGKEPCIATIEELASKFQTAIEPTAIRYAGSDGNGVGIVYWEHYRDFLKSKWIAGKRHLCGETSRSLSDMTCGPIQAYYSEGELTHSYESFRNDSSLNLTCESRAYETGAFKFVLSLFREEKLG